MSSEITPELKSTLFNAASEGHYWILKEKFKDLPSTVNIKTVTDQDRNNLLHFAVKSKSIDCIRTVANFEKFNEFDANRRLENPLHVAVMCKCSLEVIEFLADYCPTYLMAASSDEQYPRLIAESQNRIGVISLLSEKEKKYNLERYCNRVPFYFNLVRYLGRVEFTFPDEMLDSLFTSRFGDFNGQISIDVFNFVIAILSADLETFRRAYKDWLVRKIFLHESNELRSVVGELFGMEMVKSHTRCLIFTSVSDLKYNIITLLHSKYKDMDSRALLDKFKNLETISRLPEDFFNLNITSVFILMYHNHSLYKKIIKFITKVWLIDDQAYHDKKTPLMMIELIDTFDIEHDQRLISNLIEFFKDIHLENYDILGLLRDYKDYAFFVIVKSFLPFLAVPNADNLAYNFSRNYTYNIIKTAEDDENPYSFIQYCTGRFARRKAKHAFPPMYVNFTDINKYCRLYNLGKPITLKELCRFAIREKVFETNKNCTNAQKLEKLKSLNLPKPLKNFIFFIHSEHEFE